MTARSGTDTATMLGDLRPLGNENEAARVGRRTDDCGHGLSMVGEAAS
jgi:hypothetical protein